MSKINRRDYLIQMGAAGAFVGMSNLLSPSLGSAQRKQGRQQPGADTTTKPAFLFTPKTNTPPGATNLRVLLGGLIGISNTNSGVVQVGFQKGTGKHKLDINFYEKIGGSDNCYQLPSITSEELAGVKTIELMVQDQPANVHFFHKDNFQRDIGTDDRRDFGWVLDFEDSLLHPGGVTFTKPFLPVLKLSQGTLYTHQLTKSTFNLIEVVSGNPVQETIYQVPRLVGAAIDIPPGKVAILKLDGKITVQLPYIANVSYEVQFMNDCYDGGSHCKWDKPKDPNEKIRNDFYMHYLMFNPNSSTKKYGVILKDKIEGVALDKCPPPPDKGTDEAPCMASGFGGHTGLTFTHETNKRRTSR